MIPQRHALFCLKRDMFGSKKAFLVHKGVRLDTLSVLFYTKRSPFWHHWTSSAPNRSLYAKKENFAIFRSLLSFRGPSCSYEAQRAFVNPWSKFWICHWLHISASAGRPRRSCRACKPCCPARWPPAAGRAAPTQSCSRGWGQERAAACLIWQYHLLLERPSSRLTAAFGGWPKLGGLLRYKLGSRVWTKLERRL